MNNESKPLFALRQRATELKRALDTLQGTERAEYARKVLREASASVEREIRLLKDAWEEE